MAKGGVTKKIDEALKALDDNQLKKALYLTENNPKLDRHHQWIEEAARTCLANKGDKTVCSAAILKAREMIQGTITVPIDDTGIEGLEDYLTENKPQDSITIHPPVITSTTPTGTVIAVKPAGGKIVDEKTDEKTDEEIYEECEECHVAVAASAFAKICGENPEESGSCELINRCLGDENTEPVDWLKSMVETAEVATGKAKADMTVELTELGDYLQRRESPFLKALDKEENDG